MGPHGPHPGISVPDLSPQQSVLLEEGVCSTLTSRHAGQRWPALPTPVVLLGSPCLRPQTVGATGDSGPCPWVTCRGPQVVAGVPP